MKIMQSGVIQSVENDLGYANLMELIRDFVPEMSSVINKVV
ncbi:hypothetical protein [Photobacterium iliopiscarium]|nr:hypothetical protein [Photobacterium iliopiscarium]